MSDGGGWPPGRCAVLAMMGLLAAACGDDTTGAGGGSASTGSTGGGGDTATSGGTTSATTGAGGDGPGTGPGGGGGGGAPAFHLGGTIVGLEGTLALRNGDDTIAIDADGPFTFPTPLADGAAFEVSIDAAPHLSTCSVTGGDGVIEGADALAVEVRCHRKLLLFAHDGTSREVWMTDGTEEGTSMLVDLEAGTSATTVGAWQLREQRLGNGVAVLRAETSAGVGLFRTDGTPEGTELLLDAAAEPDLAIPPVDGRAIVLAAAGSGVWSTDGTVEGTVDLDLGVLAVSRFVGRVGDRLVFRARVGGGLESYVATDGTAAGTVELTERIAPSLSFPAGFGAVAGDHLFFAWDTPAEGSEEELWTTDGTPEGTARLLAPAGGVDPGPNSDIALWSVTGRLFMAVGTAEAGRELWTSDGTAAGTRMIVDLCPGPDASEPNGLAALGERVGYHATPTSSAGEYGVYLTDGTAEGTTRLPGAHTGARVVASTGERLYFTGQRVSPGPRGLFVTDGTEAGTEVLIETEMDPGPVVGTIGERVVFWADDGIGGDELFVTDGTIEGTRRLADVCPGACSAITGL